MNRTPITFIAATLRVCSLSYESIVISATSSMKQRLIFVNSSIRSSSVAVTTILLATLLLSSNAVTQELPPHGGAVRADSAFLKYEAAKKDKGVALAWSLLVPGGGVFYAGHNARFATGIGLIEATSLGGVAYLLNQQARGSSAKGDRGMITTFLLLYGVCKVVEVTHSFALIDRRNLDLWNELMGSNGDLSLENTSPGARMVPPRAVVLQFRLPL